MIVDTVREFALEQMRERAHKADENRMLPVDVIRSARELGLILANIPEGYGGFGEAHSVLTGVLFAEELAYGDLAMALHILTPASVATPLIVFGTEEQKQRYLPKFAKDGFFASAALIEPAWNFDPTALKTTAQKTADGYVISGHKSYVVQDSMDAQEHLLLVYARDEASGTTQAFLVEKESEGVEVGERERGMGLQALNYHAFTFDEVEIAASAKLGGEAGVDAEGLLNYARVGAAALATGLAKASYEYAQEYAKNREAFGKPVAQFQSIAFMLAEMRIAVESMRLLAWEAAWELDQQKDATQAAVVAKQFADEYVLQVADRAVQILGGHGYIRDYPVERWLREARVFGAVEGLAMV
ncbi:MAG: acyl-CoA dehydrogenase family protein [Chloroflexota bacterium]|nr:acyl-CoA dehydrogenase family protein [Chloroflexota bacterium]